MGSRETVEGEMGEAQLSRGKKDKGGSLEVGAMTSVGIWMSAEGGGSGHSHGWG
jgi:hypothetical protein